VVEEDQLALAIGKLGQNVRLASELTGWHLNIMTTEQREAKSEQETSGLKTMFMEKLDVDEEVAEILVQEGFTSLDEVAYVPLNEMLEIEAFDEDTVNELRRRARNSLLTEAIKSEENVEHAAEDLRGMEGMDNQTARVLATNGITTMDALADLDTEELTEMTGMEADRASKLIMTARAPWFKESQANQA
jgi:N utilization substance protein A